MNGTQPTHRVETLGTLFQNGLKRGSAIEATLAAKCMGLLVLQIGAGPDALQYVGPLWGHCGGIVGPLWGNTHHNTLHKT